MDRVLYAAALTVRGRAHAPYSRFPVGVALRTEADAIFLGANVENASFPEGWCAETSALAAMITATLPGSSGRRLAAVTVVASPIDGRFVTPCGGCRQRLAEFGTPDTIVDCRAPDGSGRSFRLGDLLPEAFALETAP